MTSISLPPQPYSASAFAQYMGPPTHSPGRHSRNLTMSAPLPNPPFVFPARSPDESSQPNPQPTSRPALPAFSFHPGPAHTSQPSLSAPAPNRGAGHRRRCSEFVGGEHLVSPGQREGSPPKDERPPQPPPNFPPPGPGFSAGGAGRRRHSHRRSAAVSSVDLTAIQNALNIQPAAGSAPSTPADPAESQTTGGEHTRPVSYAGPSLHQRMTPPTSPQILVDGRLPPHAPEDPPESPGDSPPIEADEGVSAKESRSSDTVRPEVPTRSLDSLPACDQTPSRAGKTRPRPRTADASFWFGPNEPGSSESRAKRPLSGAGHSRFRKSMSSGVLEAALRKNYAMNDDHHWTDSSRHSSSDDGHSDASGDEHGLEAGTAKKRSKTKRRQKKVRSWAGAILTRSKSKGKKQQPKTGPGSKPIPPPVLTRTNSDVGSGLDVDFDDDNTVVLRTPTRPDGPGSLSSSAEDVVEPAPSLETAWKPRSFYEQTSEPQRDVLSPIIDLDAALGPFNTPDMRKDRPESGFSAATKRMYSGGRRGEFIGPEMRYHRRAESAPEMPPFDRSFLGSARLANNPSLDNPDVFYEEEEDAFLAATSASPKKSEDRARAQSHPVFSSTDESDRHSQDSGDSSDTLAHRPTTEPVDPDAGRGDTPTREAAAAPEVPEPAAQSERNAQMSMRPASSRAPGPAPEVKDPFVDHPRAPSDAPLDHFRRMPIAHSPDVSPRFAPADHRPITSPLELPPNIPHFSLQGASLSNSPFSSPILTGSSSDVPRSIATSSTDRKFSNPSHHPYMDFPHASTDDVPSLTSSASTMTNTLNRFSASFFPRRRLSTDRSASFSATVPRRTSQANSSKRSSFASLSKLVVGPHAERSKLRHEEKPPGDEPDKGKRKGRRISRLMHFWRTKDKDRPSSQRTVPEDRPS